MVGRRPVSVVVVVVVVGRAAGVLVVVRSSFPLVLVLPLPLHGELQGLHQVVSLSRGEGLKLTGEIAAPTIGSLARLI